MTVKEYLENASDSEIISLWNRYCIKYGYNNDVYYPMCDLDVIHNIPFKELYKLLDDDFTLGHSGFWHDEQGYIYSGNRRDFINELVDLDWLANAINNNNIEEC